MSERPIQVGDLVMVVRPSSVCGCPQGIGKIFRVSKLRPPLSGFVTCWSCRRRHSCVTKIYAEGEGTGLKSVGLHRLKRIPPLGELDDVPAKEELTA